MLWRDLPARPPGGGDQDPPAPRPSGRTPLLASKPRSRSAPAAPAVLPGSECRCSEQRGSACALCSGFSWPARQAHALGAPRGAVSSPPFEGLGEEALGGLGGRLEASNLFRRRGSGGSLRWSESVFMGTGRDAPKCLCLRPWVMGREGGASLGNSGLGNSGCAPWFLWCHRAPSLWGGNPGAVLCEGQRSPLVGPSFPLCRVRGQGEG